MRIATDEYGRAVIGSGHDGLLVCMPQESCLLGLNGAGVLPGNRLLDALTGGSSAGGHAAEWWQNNHFPILKIYFLSLES